MSPANPTPSPKRGRPSIILFLIAGLVLAGIFYYLGIAPRLDEKTKLDQEQKLSMERRVLYTAARNDTPKIDLPLPGTVDAFQEASLYARTNGYVKRWLVDIGDAVHEGDVMAELDTPEVDQQLAQAQATAEHGKVSLDIAKTAADRWNIMIQAHAVSQQDADEKNATYNEAKATLDAELANVKQLTDQQSFKIIRAPFTGTVTYRNIEVGNLVSAGTGTTTSGTTEMYRVAQTDPLRVYIDVPEANTRSIHPGVKARLHVSSFPDRTFTGEVVRSAGALDKTSRTLRTEIHVPNPDGVLLPGAYADVHLELSDDTATTLIPADTLIVNSSGTQVAYLEDTGEPTLDHFKVHLVPVKVGRDFGTDIEILDGVKPGDLLITNPPSDLNTGMIVTGIREAAPAPPGVRPASTTLPVKA